MNELKIATWNLYQFAEPGTYWYERDERNDYEPDQWDAKKAWMAQTLADIDADIVGFQEIFSVDAFKVFMVEQGYPFVEVVQDPEVDPTDPAVFTTTITGIASKYPFVTPPSALSYPQELRDNTKLADNIGFRRAVTRAVISTPQLGEIVVYSCHFKSQGTFVDGEYVAQFPDWKTRFREHLRARATKDADQLVRRTSDAAGVYLAAMKELDEDAQKQIIVVGDMNDHPLSPTLRILTQQDWVDHIAEMRRSDIEDNSDKAWNYTWQLFDSYGLVPSQNMAERPVTHQAGWKYPSQTLDYILVSNALNPKNPKAKAIVTDFQVHSAHFGEIEKLLSSDHAPVSVTLTPK